MPSIDLSQIPLVDNHCHALIRDQQITDVLDWRTFFTEAAGPESPRRHVATTLFYQRLLRRLAAYFECDQTEDAVLRARQSLDARELIHRLLQAANMEVAVVDQGYPGRDEALPDAEFEELGGCRTAPLLRLEVLMQDLIVQYDTLRAVEDALCEALQDLRGQGYVGLKSVAAYRSGLNIVRWDRPMAGAGFAEARREVQEKGTVRLAHKPLLDTLLHLAFEQAAQQEMPVQFHTGYGDTDADMLLANPLQLRPILEDPDYQTMKVVLLHESYPYTRQAGYLAAVYDNVYLDLSYGIPFLGYREMVEFTRQACGVAPLSKLLYASDAVWIPELFWMSAIDGRRALGQVLSELVEDGDLDLKATEAAGQSILRNNAISLYEL